MIFHLQPCNAKTHTFHPRRHANIGSRSPGDAAGSHSALETPHKSRPEIPFSWRLRPAYLCTSLLINLRFRRSSLGSRTASRGSAVGWSNSFACCSGESGSLLLIPSDDSELSASLDERNASRPGNSAARRELRASRPKAERAPSSDAPDCMVDDRLTRSC